MKTLVETILLYILIVSSGYAQKAEEKKMTASFESRDNKITIYYELQGKADTDYKIDVVLKKNNDSFFSLKPQNLQGDCCKGKYANGQRMIIWSPTDSELDDLEGDDYYFELKADEAVSGGFPWYIALGGLMLAGATATLVIFLK